LQKEKRKEEHKIF